ncbi:hypothetical protein [Arenimonas donghaensis]|uniref:AsmA domain-containing protein n=1 Tax=Arenimonas donghaensis DSM 18148 = HO3-R19 TaxID=1121014 RepID=A0A087MIM3_9GAMM|nr:hypothetical protein [Arenimonas donghaensis]KFL36726.1 hypothetical protein N788_03710 [Arenimonas donghaensis DSM 18148 = HO3-R19]
MAPAPRKRRWPWVLGIGLALLAAAGLWINHQLEPSRLARTVLSALGESQGLEITFEGQPAYALRPEPRLVLPNVVARQPGAAAPLLTAGRAEISLPWDTVWGGDDTVVITRIELERSALDLAALADWRQSRPPAGVFEVPTLTRGIEVVEGRVQGDGWHVQDLSLALDHLAANEPARIELAGTFVRESLRVSGDAVLTVEKAGESTAFGLLAEGVIEREPGSLPYRLEAADCFFHRQEPELGVNCTQSQFTGTSPLPSVRADRLSYSQGQRDGKTRFRLEGSMPEWPGDWPVLPEPASQVAVPTRFTVDYAGAADLSDPLSAKLERGETTLDATLVIADMQAWLADENRRPVPPLRGRFSAPALVIEGFTLEDVQAEIVEPAPAGEE